MNQSEPAVTAAASFALPSGERIPAISVEQMREVDRAMVEDFHIDLIQMMENAGRNLADLTKSLFNPQSVTILAGPGGNGGGGLVAARHLHNRGIEVKVVITEDQLAPVTKHQLDIVGRMGIAILERPTSADLVIDSLIGYALHGNPTGRSGDLISWANDNSSPILALDGPSGLDLTSGEEAVPCVQATATMTLALPKYGLANSKVVGRLYLADISVPPDLLPLAGGTNQVLFGSGPIIQLN